MSPDTAALVRRTRALLLYMSDHGGGSTRTPDCDLGPCPSCEAQELGEAWRVLVADDRPLIAPSDRPPIAVDLRQVSPNGCCYGCGREVSGERKLCGPCLAARPSGGVRRRNRRPA